MSTPTTTHPLRVLLIDEDSGRAAILEQALCDAGHSVLARLESSADLIAQVQSLEPDVIIIDMESPDRDTLESMRVINRDHPRPVMMFAEDQDSRTINQAIQAGVSAYVVDDLNPGRVKPLLDVAVARFREYQALRNELAQARNTLEEQELIKQAKRLLMKQRQCDEAEAYQALRKLAMDRGQKMAEAARTVIAVIDLLD